MERKNVISEVCLSAPLLLDRGDPSYDTPHRISLAGVRAIKAGKTHYADPAGTVLLRQAITQTLLKEFDVEYDPQQEILVTAGASPAIFVTLMALTSPNDDILVPEPYWPTYLQMITSLNRRAIFYPMPFALGEISPDDWCNALRSKITSSTRLIIINSPHNPTGTRLDAVWLSCLTQLCEENPNLVILSDEPYHRIVFDGVEHISPASLPQLQPRTVVIHTFSKTYSMAGWRIGYIAAPLHLAKQIRAFHLSMNCCASSISQEAALWAITNGTDIVEDLRLRYQSNRDYLVKELNNISNFSCYSPQGTFYLFPDVSGFGVKSKELSELLAKSERVFVYPGSNYGIPGEYHIRICFASTRTLLEELVRRLTRFVHNWENSH